MLDLICGPPPGADGWRGSLVLVHGIDGDAGRTWGLGDAAAWPRRVAGRLGGIAVLSATLPHRTFRWAGRIEADVEQSAAALVRAMADLRLLDRPCVIASHSLGGLVVRRAICDAPALDGGRLRESGRRLRGIVFLGVPHRGSPLAESGASWLLGRFQTQAARDLRGGSRFLRDLDARFPGALASAFDRCRVVNVRETRAVAGFLPIPGASALADAVARLLGPVVPPDRSEIAAALDLRAPAHHLDVARLRFEGAARVLAEIEDGLAGPGAGSDAGGLALD